MQTISGDNTDNVCEYNDKSVTQSVENWQKDFFPHLQTVKGPYFDIGCTLVMHMSAWWIINILRDPLKRRYGKRSLFLHILKQRRTLSTVNPLLKFVKLLHTKSEKKLPHDNISISCCSKSLATIISPSTSAMHFGPRTLLFWKIGYKMLKDIFFSICARSENEGTERSLEQSGVHRSQSSGINFAAPNKTSILELKNGIEITPGIIETAMLTPAENNLGMGTM